MGDRKRIGAYEKHQEIGRGTYGTVYAGLQVETKTDVHRRVAIKKVLGRSDVGKHEATYLKLCRDAKHVVQVCVAACLLSLSLLSTHLCV